MALWNHVTDGVYSGQTFCSVKFYTHMKCFNVKMALVPTYEVLWYTVGSMCSNPIIESFAVYSGV